MRILSCLATQHDLLFVAVAAAFCIFGSWTSIRLFMRSRERLDGAAWVFLTAIAAGSTVWCTHFIAILAYRPGVPVSYEPVLTGVSLMVAIVFSAIGLWIARGAKKTSAGLGGAIIGGGVAAMHFTGMAAFAADGLITWDVQYILLSVFLSVGLCYFAFAAAGHATTGSRREFGGATLFVLAIVALHFTGMAALTIVPLAPRSGALTNIEAYNTIAVAVAGVGLLMLGAGLAGFLVDRQGTIRARTRLAKLVDSTVDGVVIEMHGKIVQANKAFETMFDEKREDLRGKTFCDLIACSYEIRDGALIRANLKPANGTAIPVEILVRQDHTIENDTPLMVYHIRDLRQRIAQERRIAHLAHHDSLTGLPNRAAFLEHLEQTIESTPMDGRLALFAIDLNRFKEINDLHGHAAGDQVLQTLSDRMSAQLQEGEFLARLGGDEFVATAKLRTREEAIDLAKRLERQLFAPMSYEHTELVCGASIGIAVYPDDGGTATALMNNADLAMYRSKSSLIEPICFYEEEMDERVRIKRKVMMELREAIAREDFELHYQLQASLATESVTAYEALLRWKHPEHGYISPGDFIPLAEETGLILPLGEWVLRKACEAAAAWEVPHKIAVNLSAIQLGSLELPRIVHETLLETGLKPERLELEITETALIQDKDRTTHILRQIKALGVSIAMDDFGVGYSSLSTLRAFPFDKIKLDKSFMGEIDRSPQARAIIRAVLTLGENLGIPVLAEGVETAAQLDFLKEVGCDEVQGYLLGRPDAVLKPITLPGLADAKRKATG